MDKNDQLSLEKVGSNPPLPRGLRGRESLVKDGSDTGSLHACEVSAPSPGSCPSSGKSELCEVRSQAFWDYAAAAFNGCGAFPV